MDDASAADPLEESVPFWDNLFTGGKLQREADARARARREGKGEGGQSDEQ